MRAYGTRTMYGAEFVVCRLSSVNFFLKVTSSQEPLGQFQPHLVGNMHALGMGIQICSRKGAGPLWGPIRAKL